MNPVAWVLSFLPATAVYALAGTVLLLGVGAVIYALFPLPYRRAATLAGPVIVGAACWFGGVAATQSVAETAALREQLAEANLLSQRQQAQLAALSLDSMAAAANAVDLRRLQERIHELETITPDGACLDLPTSDRVRALWSK